MIVQKEWIKMIIIEEIIMRGFNFIYFMYPLLLIIDGLFFFMILLLFFFFFHLFILRIQKRGLKLLLLSPPFYKGGV